jgi:adhesin transport system membrane fusion protein
MMLQRFLAVWADMPTTHRQLAISSVLMTFLLIWAFVAPLDVVSNAIGEVLPMTRVKSVQHLEGGTVTEILVREGDGVEQDQPLVLLDPVRADSEFEELTARLQSLNIDRLRLEAEIAGKATPGFSEQLRQDNPQRVIQAEETFRSRKNRMEHDLQIQKSLIEQRQQEALELEARLHSSRKSLELLREQVHISENLLKKELTNRMVHLDLARQLQNLQGQIETDQATLPRIEASLKEARERMASLLATQIEKAGEELTEARRSYEELSQRALKYKQARERTVLRSPVKGIVKTLAVAARGEVVQPGQTIIEIVPVDDRLVIEAKLPLQDIGYVHEGQSVRVTLNTPDASQFGHIEGVIRTVSPDAIVTNDKGAFYKVRIETSNSFFSARDQIYRLYPGMQVLCSIRTGTRKVGEYLLGPWSSAMRFALEER